MVILVLLLLGAHLNLTALVSLQPGGTPPPWWVRGRLVWPFAVETNTLLPPGEPLNALTPLPGIAAAICVLLAAVAPLRRLVLPPWFRGLIAAGAVTRSRCRSSGSLPEPFCRSWSTSRYCRLCSVGTSRWRTCAGIGHRNRLILSPERRYWS